MCYFIPDFAQEFRGDAEIRGYMLKRYFAVDAGITFYKILVAFFGGDRHYLFYSVPLGNHRVLV